MGLGFAAFGAELPELEARCHEHLYYARPTVLAATEDPQGTRVLNLFARDWKISINVDNFSLSHIHPVQEEEQNIWYTSAKIG